MNKFIISLAVTRDFIPIVFEWWCIRGSFFCNMNIVYIIYDNRVFIILIYSNSKITGNLFTLIQY